MEKEVIEHKQAEEALRSKEAELLRITENTPIILAWFLDQAHRERQYPLTKKAKAEQALKHLDLLSDGQPKHAAILLFDKNPQHFVISAEVKCLHFRGTTAQKPIPS